MSADLRRPSGAVTGMIVVFTVMLAYSVHLSGNLKVTIALLGVLLALVVRDRLRLREYRQDHEFDEDASEA
ncbi:hypothetical protein [Brachybacterium endophyticum]|uniref:hypothetical protein n=1 Tax=Brachybacterium endophyticum TaxID=2182385 RepID=UPI0010581034|nr:hypothetical protein [Brachybacterium endophyticum]